MIQHIFFNLFTGPKSRNWSFRLTDYEIFLAQLKPFAEIERIPAFVLKVLRQPVAMLDNSCLDSIEPIIAESLLTFQRESVAWGISRGGRLLLGRLNLVLQRTNFN